MASSQTIRLSLAACGLAAALVALVRAREVRQQPSRRAPPALSVATAEVSPPRAASSPLELAPPPPDAPAVLVPDAGFAERIADSAPLATVTPLAVPPPLAPVPSAAPVPRGPRRVPFSLLAAWHQPGLCPASAEVSALRDKMRASFRQVGEGDAAWTLYLDPRLPEGTEQQLLSVLDAAQAAVGNGSGFDRRTRPCSLMPIAR